MIPPSGVGSLKSMSSQDVVSAASANTQLSVFVAAVRSAGLDKTLSAKKAFTLMIPANSAFASLSASEITALKNSAQLQKVVKYHIVDSRVTPQQFAAGARVPTAEGTSLTLTKSGTTYHVGGATVLCGNINTANATVYLLDKVLLPPA